MKSLLEAFLEKSTSENASLASIKTETHGRESPDSHQFEPNQSKKTLTEGRESPDRELLFRHQIPLSSLLTKYLENPPISIEKDARKTLTNAKEHPDSVAIDLTGTKKTRTDEGRESPDHGLVFKLQR